MSGARSCCCLAAALLLAGCTTSPVPDPPASAPSSGGAVSLSVDVVVDGLDHAWDVVQAPDGTLLVDQRGGGFTAVPPDGAPHAVQADFGDLFARGETGLMGLALDPAFATNRRLYSCQGVQEGDRASIAVIAWTVAEDWSAATRAAQPLVAGIPVNGQSGRHGGCRLRFASDGALLIGTGDNARGTNPQDLGSVAGKVLRVDPATGGPMADNPIAAAPLVYTYGHRNVQGLAVRPGGGQVFSVEHGPDRDDEVNLLTPGANYGWDPDGVGGYDESVPMTDPAIEGAVAAVWSSGEPTLATSGATFVSGAEWGDYEGLLLVGLLKGTGVLALRLDDSGAVVDEFRVPELDERYGRLRSLALGVDGALYVTTDNGGDDKVLRVTPTR